MPARTIFGVKNWIWLVPRAGIEPARPLWTKAADFKSAVSTYSTIEAVKPCIKTHSRAIWRRRPESNRPTRICNPVHNRFVTAPKLYQTNQYFSSCLVLTVFTEYVLPYRYYLQKREAWASLFEKLEREKSLELSTSTLARLRSTNWAIPAFR